jgi:hypothetical protein
MTEQEWLACTDPKPMLAFLGGNVSDRKLRLFACACCRFVSCAFLPTRGVELALTVAEALADRVATPEALAEARSIVPWARWEMATVLNRLAEALEIALQAKPITIADAIVAAERVLEWIPNAPADANMSTHPAGKPFSEIPRVARFWPEPEASAAAERAVQSDALRCIFGPSPLNPIQFNHSWLTPTVAYLAQCIYDEREFDCLPILADALAEEGCNHVPVLGHCREHKAHVRGCWVVDLLTGRQ